jgi:predicted glycoside hydrolase/deacetylase ChbG (UPF0249 family)
MSPGEIRLLIRADDMGSCHAANTACVKTYREGIMRSVEVIVPGPWFLEAAALLAENPGLDVGVHLTLTSEWDLLKWRPLTAAPSLVDADGYFYPNVGEAGKPGSGLFGAPRWQEIERELRAQIETARRHIKNVTHLSTHMFGPSAAPELKTIIDKLAQDYGLPLELDEVQWLGSLGEWPKTTFAQKEDAMAAHLEHLTPGRWFFLDHPGSMDPEMQAMYVTPWYPNVAADRDGVTRLFTSPRIREIVARRGIKLVSYGDVLRERRAARKD